MERKIRAVLIGFGGMGSMYAKLIYGGLVPGMTLAGVCCRNAQGQALLHREFPGVAVYTSVEDTVAHKEAFDCALIVTPHTTHIPIGTALVQADKPILLDKPAGISAAEVSKLVKLCNAKALPFAMMFNNRRLPAFQTAKKFLEQGKLGTLHRAVWVCNNWYRSPAYHRSAGWRSSWRGECGGLLINQNQHYLDLWQWLFGMPQKVYAAMEFGRYNDFLVDDAVDIQFSYDNGFHGTMISSTGEAPGINRLEVWGSKGCLRVENGTAVTFCENQVSTEEFAQINTQQYASIPSTSHTIPIAATDYTQPYREVLGNFASHLLRDTPLYADGMDGLRTVALTNACYLSGWQEKRVTLPVEEEEFCRELSQRQALELSKVRKKH